MKWWKKGEKGSFTVEASILIPFLIFVMVAPINMSINIYTEIKDWKDEKENEWMVGEFYIVQGIKETRVNK